MCVWGWEREDSERMTEVSVRVVRCPYVSLQVNRCGEKRGATADLIKKVQR